MSHFDILNKVMCRESPPMLQGRVLVRETSGGVEVLNDNDSLITVTASGLWSRIGVFSEADFIAQSHHPVYCYDLEDRDSYIDEQMKWVKENKITTGSLLTVTRRAYSYQRGWDNTWAHDMNGSVGKTLVVKGIHQSAGIWLCDMFHFPYFVLEPA